MWGGGRDYGRREKLDQPKVRQVPALIEASDHRRIYPYTTAGNDLKRRSEQSERLFIIYTDS